MSYTLLFLMLFIFKHFVQSCAPRASYFRAELLPYATRVTICTGFAYESKISIIFSCMEY